MIEICLNVLLITILTMFLKNLNGTYELNAFSGFLKICTTYFILKAPKAALGLFKSAFKFFYIIM